MRITKMYVGISVFVFAVIGCSAAKIEPYFNQIDLFEKGRDGYHNHRIPALIVTRKGTVLAFCEGRSEFSDQGAISLVLKRSFDNGKTWEPIQVIWSDPPNTCGNPCPVVDRDTGTIWLFVTHNLGEDLEPMIWKGTSKGTRTVWVMKSTDDGETWLTPVNITKDVKKADWTWYATGPGVGIQLKSGRLIIPCDHGVTETEEGDLDNYSHVFYSDDHGISWHIGGSVNHKFGSECQVVEDIDGRLLINIRNCDIRIFFQNPPPVIIPYRTIATSDDGGLTWSEAWQDSTLIEPGPHGCQASLLRFTDGKNHDKNRLLFSNPASTETREKMTVRLSYDEGMTWPVSNVINPGPSGYSCLAILEDGTIACLYERGDDDSAEKITFAVFNLEWLISGTDELPKR